MKGYVSSAVLLYDAEYVVMRNIEITNSTLRKERCTTRET